jgi:hypothetical protein
MFYDGYNQAFGWTTKPPFGTPININHPLAESLSLFYPINEGRGPVLTEGVNGLSAGISGVNFNVNAWQNTKIGLVLNPRATTNAGALSPVIPKNLQSPWPMTLAVSVLVANQSNISTQQTIAGLTTDTGVTQGYLFKLNSTSTTAGFVLFNSNGTNLFSSFTLPSPLTFAQGAIVTMCVRIDSKQIIMAINGKISVIKTAAQANPRWSVSPRFHFGMSDPQSSSFGPFSYYWGGVWSRGLSNTEMINITSNPNYVFNMYRSQVNPAYLFQHNNIIPPPTPPTMVFPGVSIRNNSRTLGRPMIWMR